MDAFICDALRTPIGRFGGALASVRADDLAALPIEALISCNPSLDAAQIDEVILGCANQAGEDNRNVARMAALLAGLPATVPAVTVNRLCASGAEAIGQAARAVMTGEAELIIAGGVESMTRAPFVMAKADKPWSRTTMLEDTTIGWRFINQAMRDRYGVDSMPETAENVAQDFGVSRKEQDEFALSSQQRASAAQASGFFSHEIIAVTTKDRKGRSHVVDVDEHLRPDTTLDQLAALKPIVRANGTVTAGNSSGVNDGSAAMVIASERAVERFGLTPRARVLGMASAGVDPRIMGIGPVPAIEKLTARIKRSLSEFDIIEINEAFAAQVIACMRKLNVDPLDERVNPNGGAIALGHPLGTSGARLVMTATHALQAGSGKSALVTMCVGVGQGLALAIERV